MIRKASVLSGLVNASSVAMSDGHTRARHCAGRCGGIVATAFLVVASLTFTESGLAANASSQADKKVNELSSHIHESRSRIFRAESGKTLTARSTEDTLVVAKIFLNSNNVSSTATDALVQSRKFKNGGLVVADYEQQIRGLRVHGSHVRAVTKETGELVFISSNIVAPNSQPIRSADIDDQRALVAVVKIHYPKSIESFPMVKTKGNSREFSKGKSFSVDPRVEKILVSQTDGTLEEGYLVETWDHDNVLKHTVVNSRGRVVSQQNRTAYDSYNIYPVHPEKSVQTVVTGAGSGNTQSPIGWIFADTTRGNNGYAYVDTNADYVPDPDGMPISSTRNFLTPAQLNLPPEYRDNQLAAVQNAFYWTNVIHDELYRHGFTEAVGNFQHSNFISAPPLSDLDPVLVQVQDGSFKNNASFATPPDGYAPILRLHLFDAVYDEHGFPTGKKAAQQRDSAFDIDTLWHEYGHGLQWRLIPDMTSTNNGITGAVGEGLSDALSIIMMDDSVTGEYLVRSSRGIRREPYAGYTMDLNFYYCGYYSINCNAYIHYNGEHLAAAFWRLWELWKAQGLPKDGLLDAFVQMLSVAPPRPTFADIRDSLLLSVNSQNQCMVWQAFAPFGMGVGGGAAGTATAPTVSFIIPSACSGDSVAPSAISDVHIGSIGSRSAQIAFTATGDDGVAGSATEYDIRYSTNPITKFNFDSATKVQKVGKPLVSSSAELVSVRDLLPATRYYIAARALDEVGNKGDISNVIAVTTLPARTLFKDTFDVGVGAWTFGGTDGNGGAPLWRLTNHRSSSPDNALYYGYAGALNYDTGSANTGTTTSLPIDLQTAIESTLTFNHFLDTEGLFEFYDKARVEVSQDGGANWEPVFVAQSNTKGAFERVTIDLKPFDGKIIQIRFVFDSVDAGANQYEGWIVDDVTVDAVGDAGANLLPVAVPGNDQIVISGQKVFLNGMNSYDNDGVVSSYRWEQISGPLVALNNSTAAIANFIAPSVTADTVLTYKLTVTDNAKAAGFETTSITIKKANTAPTSNAGTDQTVVKGAVVTLSGTGADGDGTVTSYVWSQIGGPAVTLANPASAITSFTAPMVTSSTVLTFRLTAIDDFGASTSDDVAITIQYINFVPVANAGPDQAVNKQVTVTLSGSATDSDGTIASYKWAQTSGTAVTLKTPAAASTIFTSPRITVDTTLTFSLTVTDNLGATGVDTIIVLVKAVNTAPTANAGPDQTVVKGVTVTLTGTGSDVDGTIASYAWAKTVGPKVTILNGTKAVATFVAPTVTTATVMTFTLTVKDNGAATKTDTVNITVMPTNTAPVANAGIDQVVNKGSIVALPGVGTDSDGTISAYAWTQTAGPAVTLVNAGQQAASFLAPLVLTDTVYTFQLKVMDNLGLTGTDLVIVTVKNVNLPPVVNAGTDQNVAEQAAVTLSASATDQDGTVLNYSWTQISGPTVTLSNANTANAAFTSPQVSFNTSLTFQVTAIDNSGASGSDSVKVTILNGNVAPVANAGADQFVTEQVTAGLYGSGNDSDGLITNYLWTQVSGPVVTIAGSTSAVASFDSPLVATDTLFTFQLRVMDNTGLTATDTVNITVQKSNLAPIANAGSDQTAGAGKGVTLSGTASDSDGTITSYQWIQTAGNTVTLLTPYAASTQFVAPSVTQPTTLVFQLRVTDNKGVQAQDEIRVTVNPNRAPIANVGGPYYGATGVGINFYGGNSSDADRDQVTYSWNFGDGTTATGVSPTHVYSAAGTFTVTLKVNDGMVDSAPVSTSATVAATNGSPIPVAGGPYLGIIGTAVLFDGSASFDPNGEPLSYKWTFGDGTKGAGAAPAKVYNTPGVYTVSLVVNDGMRDSSIGTAIVEIQETVNTAPKILSAKFAQRVILDNETTSLAANVVDKDTPSGALQYLWTVNSGEGFLDNPTAASPTYTPPDVTGNQSFTITLSVSDGIAQASTSLVVTVLDTTSIGGVVQDPAIAMSGTISSNRVLAANQAYQLSAAVTVAAGVTLTIEPGVVLTMPSNTSITVNGTLRIVGTSASAIRIQPPAAATYAGTIYIRPTSSDSVMDHVLFDKGALQVDGAKIIVSNSTFNGWSGAIYMGAGASGLIAGNAFLNPRTPSSGYALYLSASSPDVVRNSFQGGNLTGGSQSIGINLVNSSARINDGNEITGFGTGIGIDGYGNPVINRNVFGNNRNYFGELENVVASGYVSGQVRKRVDIEHNWWGTADIEIIANSISTSVEASSLLADFVPFLKSIDGEDVAGNYLDGQLATNTTLLPSVTYIVPRNVIVPVGVTLNIQSGTQLLFTSNYGKLSVEGSLNISGAEDAPAVLAASQLAPTSYGWSGIQLQVGSVNNTIDYADISGEIHVMSTTAISKSIIHDGGCIRFDNASGSVTDSIVYGCSMGVTITSASPTITGNIITGNDFGIIIYGSNTVGKNPAPVIRRNSIFLNNTWAAGGGRSINLDLNNYYAFETATLDVSENWWGSADAIAIRMAINDRVKDASVSYKRPFANIDPYLDGPNGNLVYGPQALSGPVTTNTTLIAGAEYNVFGFSTFNVNAGATLTVPSGTILNIGSTNVEVAVGASLIIQSGAVLKFTTGMIINKGELRIVGTSAARVQLQSSNDLPAPYYSRIYCWGGRCTISYADFRATGTAITADQSAVVEIDHSSFYVKGSDSGVSMSTGVTGFVTDSEFIGLDAATGYGIGLYDSSSSILRNTFKYFNVAIEMRAASNPEIRGNVINENDYGVKLGGGTYPPYPNPFIEGNQIFGNKYKNIDAAPVLTGYQFIINAPDNWWGSRDLTTIVKKNEDMVSSPIRDLNIDQRPAIAISTYLDSPNGLPVTTRYLNGIIAANTTLQADAEYVVGRLYVPAGITLTIPSGVTLKFLPLGDPGWDGGYSGGGIDVFGTITVAGDALNPVTFTSLNHYQPPAGFYWYGDWTGIYLNAASSSSTFDNVVIERARRGIYLVGASATITNATIQDNLDGIDFYSEGAVVIKNSTIANNYWRGIYVGTHTGTGVVINNNDIYGNGSYGMYIASTAGSFNAQGNWWGTTTPSSAAKSFYAGSSVTLNTSNYALSALRISTTLSATVTKISPNGDGTNDSTIITGTVVGGTPSINWTLSIINASGTTIRSYTGAGTAVSQVWDARDSNGVIVPEGRYTARLTGTTGGANQTVLPSKVQLDVDVGVPTVQITSPTYGTTLWNAISISGTATDPNGLKYYLLEYGAGAAPSAWNFIANGTQSVTNGLLGTWVSNPYTDVPIPNGVYTLRLTVVDQANNFAIATTQVQLDNLHISNISRTASTIRPLMKETSKIQFALDRAAHVVVRIAPELTELKSNGDQSPELEAVRVFDLGNVSSGSYSVTWDGKNGAGNYVVDEAYIYVVEALTADGRFAKFNRYVEDQNSNPVNPIDLPIPASVVASYNPYKNQFINMPFTFKVGPARWSLAVYQNKSSASTLWDYSMPKIYASKNNLAETGVTQNVFWDGRDEAGNIITGTYMYYFTEGASGEHTFTPVKTNHIMVKGGVPSVPGVSIKADPYIVYLSYGQMTRIKYHLDDAAQVTIKVKDPVTKVETLVTTNEMQVAGDHEVIWNGGSDAGLMPNEGHYMFTVTATNPRTGFGTSRRGNITVYR